VKGFRLVVPVVLALAGAVKAYGCLGDKKLPTFVADFRLRGLVVLVWLNT